MMTDTELAQHYRVAQVRAMLRLYREAHGVPCPSVEALTVWAAEVDLSDVRPEPQDFVS
jgi:hypothetical protein